MIVRHRRLWVIFSVFMFVVFCTSFAGANPADKTNNGGTIEKLLKFSDGLAGICVQGKWGFIDTAGKRAIEPRFSDIHSFHEGYAPVKMENKWGLIDRKGKYAILPRYEDIGEFSEGLVAVKLKGHWGFADRNGKTVIPHQFAEAKAFFQGKAAARQSNLWGYIDKEGLMAIKPAFTGAGSFGEGLAPVQARDKWEYINEKGQVVIKPQFDMAMEFSGGLAAVMIDTKWGFINPKGVFVINPLYEDAQSFSGKLAAVQTRDKWGYIDGKGKDVIPFSFQQAGDFSDGVALVQLNTGQSAYIYPSGKAAMGLASIEGVFDVGIWYTWESGHSVIIVNLSADDLIVHYNTTGAGGLLPLPDPKTGLNAIPSWSTWTDYALKEIPNGNFCMYFRNKDSLKTDNFCMNFNENTYINPKTSQYSTRGLASFRPQDLGRWKRSNTWSGPDHTGPYATNTQSHNYQTAFTDTHFMALYNNAEKGSKTNFVLVLGDATLPLPIYQQRVYGAQ
ncbi:MAG: WG repeat-containing protein [Deltaproteobacteria bacterium]